MPDYSTSKIYKIICDTTQETYIGSTINPLSRRLGKHISDAKHKSRVCASKQIIDRGNFKIELLEEFPCNTKQELLFKEREWIEQSDCINKVKPIVTDEEKKELQHRISKRWNHIYSKIRHIQCECGGTYTYKHKARHEATIAHRLGIDPVFRKQHEEETAKRKDEQKQREQEYKKNYASNLEQIREKYANTEHVKCECGHSHHPKQTKMHLKSVIHRSVMDAEYKAEIQAKQEASRIKERERKTTWEREKRRKLQENNDKQL